MRRFGGFFIAVMVLLALSGPASTANLAAYRCAGAGTLTATFTPGPSPPSTAGYTWAMAASGACVASPNGPWLFTASGRGHNGSCGTPATTTSTARLYEPFVVTFQLSNPRTGVTQTIQNVWYFTGSALAYVVAIRSGTSGPSCSSPAIGGQSGLGVLVRGLDPTPVVTGGSVETYPATFAVHFR